MMAVTHAAISISVVSATLGTADGWVLSIALIGSQLPDLDSTESLVGRALYPIARWLEERYSHRSVTHSFVATGILALMASPVLLFFHWHYWCALVLGHFCGWFADCFTRSGVACFFPSTARMVIPGNPRARITSNSPAEYWVLAVATVLAVALFNLNSAGGVSEQFAQAFLTDSSTAAQLFRKYGSQREIVIEVSGIHAHSSQSVAGKFTVIEATENDVIAEERLTGKLYKIGSAPDVQIRPTRIRVVSADRPLSITAQELELTEISVADWATRLPPTAYISGALVLDDLEDVQIPLEIQQYPALRVFGGQIELSNARPPQILALLKDFWILNGKVILKHRSTP